MKTPDAALEYRKGWMAGAQGLDTLPVHAFPTKSLAAAWRKGNAEGMRLRLEMFAASRSMFSEPTASAFDCYGTIERRAPYRTRKEANTEFLSWVCDTLPPDHLIPEHSWSQLEDDLSMQLQDFVSLHSRTWAAGIGLLEAMDVAVNVAEENGNLKG